MAEKWINPNFLNAFEEETKADLEELVRLIFNHVHGQEIRFNKQNEYGLLIGPNINQDEATKAQVDETLREIADSLEGGVKIS